MFDLLARLGRWLSPKQRRKQKRSAARFAAELMPTLQVRTLEERRVFHAGAVAAPQAAANQQQPPPPPPPTTTITLDAGHNLLVQDAAAGGKNDQLAIRFDASRGGYVITSASQALATEIAGARGNGTSHVFIPVVQVAGGKVIVATGQGNDSLNVDLSQGLGGKALVFDGGAGNDAVALAGRSYGSVSYVFSADGTTQIQAGQGANASHVLLQGVEPVHDQLVADVRRFTIGSGIASATLGNDESASSGATELTTSLGTSVFFVTPQSQLTIDVGAAGRLVIDGTTNLKGADLTVRAGSLDVSGKLVSHQATIDLAAKSTLTVTASGVIDSAGGRVLLDAGAGGTLSVSGQIDVSATTARGVGGTVHLLGREVKLLDGADVNASGTAGGGTVLVGGDYQGLNPLVRLATNTLVAADASIHANALASGHGGKIIVWADEVAIVAGSGNLQARGGSQGGHGGFIETSGKRYLAIGGAADAGGPRGYAGTWLLDPFNVEIVAGTGGTIPASGDFTPAANTTIGADTIEAALATTNVTIFTGTGGNDADGNITVSSEISVALGNGVTRTLTLNAAHNVIVAANITATTGSLNVALNANSTAGGQDDPDTAIGSVTISGAITTLGGTFSSTGLDFTNTGTITTGAGTVSIDHAGDVTLGANITSTAAATIVTSAGAIAFDNAATLTAASATLTATAGTITADEAGTDIDTSGGTITLSGAGGIGSSSRAITVAAGAGVVTATAGDADIYLESTTDLNLGAITTGAGTNTVSIAADSAAGLDISIGATSTTNDNWTLVAGDDIDFVGAVTITANSANLTATAGAISADTAATHIDTSAAGGAITLLSALGIGSSGQALTVAANGGAVTATTGDADIYLESTTDLNLGAITTGAGVNTVSITADDAAGLDVSIGATSTTNDNWTLTATGNIGFSGTVRLNARTATLDAGGAITSGADTVDIDTHVSGGAISLMGDLGIGTSGNRFLVRADDGLVTAATDSDNGHIFLGSTGALDLGAVSTKAGAHTVDIHATSNATDDIAIEATSITDDNWTLTASANIDFVGNAHLGARSAVLDAGGALLGGSNGVDVDTHLFNGNISLVGDLGIGTNANPFLVRADDGTVTAATTGATGHIFLQSTDSLDLGAVSTGAGAQTVDIRAEQNADDTIAIEASSTTDDNWTLHGRDGIAFVGNVTLTADSATLISTGGEVTSGAAASDIVTTTSVSIEADAIGAAGIANALVLRPGSGDVSLDADSGAINVAIETLGSSFQTSQLSKVENTAGGSTVTLTVLDGQFTLNGWGNFATLSNDVVTLRTAGMDNNIHLASATTFNVVSLTLAASGAITSAGNAAVLTTGNNQPITLTADSIGTEVAPVIVQPGDTLSVTASGDIYLRQATGNLVTSVFTLLTSTGAGGVVSIGTLAGNVNIDDIVGFIDLADDLLEIEAGGAGSDIEFNTTLVAGDVRLIANDAIISDAGAATDIDTSLEGGDIALRSGGPIGTDTNELRVTAGDGVVAIATTGSTGNVFLLSVGDLQLGTVTTDGGSTQTVEIGTTTGNLTLTVDNTLNDNVALQAAGDLVVNDDVTTTAQTFTNLAAVGLIVSGRTDEVDFATTGAAADVLRITGGSVGTQGNPLHIDHEGKYALTATGDLWLMIADGNLLTSDVTSVNMPGAGTLGLITANGSITVDSSASLNGLADNQLYLEARGLGSNIILDQAAATLTFASATLVADSGSIVAISNGLAINTSGGAGGNIMLRAQGPIGSDSFPIGVQAGGGLVSATTTGAAGNIYLHSQSQLHLGLINAQDTSVAQTIDLTSALGIEIEVASVTGDNWVLEAQNGGIAFDGAGSLTANTVALTATADIDFNGTGGIVATGGLMANTVILTATGNIDFNGTGGIVATGATLNAGGNITSSGTAAVDVNTSATQGPIVLNAGGIGTLGNRLNIALGLGILDLTANTADAFLRVTSPGFATSQIAAAQFGAANRTFDLALASGDLTVDTFVAVVDSIGALRIDTNVALRTEGVNANIDFTGVGAIVAADATLVATGAITTLPGGIDIFAFGDIDLTANLGVGADGAPIVVRQLGSGDVDATTTTGNVYLASPFLLTLGTVSTSAGGGQIVDVRSSTGLAISGASNTNDNWMLFSAGDLSFVGTGSIAAATVNANAAGSLFSGNATSDIIASGVVNLNAVQQIGTQANGLAVITGASGLVNATTASAFSGDVFLASGGLLRIGLITTQPGANQVSVADLSGSSNFEIVGVNSTDDTWTLNAGNNITFVAAGSIVARQITADAGGNIISGAAAIDVSTNGFNQLIDLEAVGAIGTEANPLAVLAWPSPVRAVGHGGDVYLTSPGALYVDVASAGGLNPDVSLTTTGNQTPLIAAVATLGNDNWHLFGTGEITLEVTGNMAWDQLLDLRSVGAGRSITVRTVTGSMEVNAVANGVATADDNLTVISGAGNLRFSGPAQLVAANARLRASNGSILSNSFASRIDVAGSLRLEAEGGAGTIGSAANAFGFSAPQLSSKANDGQWLAAANPTRVIQAETTDAGGSISLVEGTFYLATSLALPPNTPSVDTTMLHVQDGALLGGNGIVQGGLHVLADGVVNMGFGQSQVGRLRVQGGIDFDAGSELVVDINSPYTIAGRDYDHVQVTGNVVLNNSTLTLRGAQDLRVTINPLILFDLAPGMITTGGFAVDNISLFMDGTDVRARVGQFRGKLSFFGGPDNNDIILNDLSLVPPVQQTGFRLPPPRIPIFTRSEQVPVVVQSPPPIATSVEVPAIEVKTEAVGIRKLEIRIVVPIDEAGNVEEVFAFELPAEWLTNLPAILRRLPDDRYRIYLILEGGNEERLVMDVLVRDGRPVEPNETQAQEDADPLTAEPEVEPAIIPPASSHPALLPALPDLQPADVRDRQTQAIPGPGRFFVGASAAVAAVVASRRSPQGREKEVDAAAEAIGRTPPPTHSRWWRFSQNTTTLDR